MSARSILLCLAFLTPVAYAQTPDNTAGPDYAFEAEQARKREMEAAKKLLEIPTLDDFQRADLMLRLADLYFQEGRALYMAEVGTFEEGFVACELDPRCSEPPPPDHTESRTWLDGSVRITQKLLADHADYPRRDEALYTLANTEQELGQPGLANDHYTQLVREFPDSDMAPDAFLQIGEFRFDNAELMPALAAYSRAASFEDYERRPYALYKKGWVLYNLGEYDEALDTMKRVIVLSDDSRISLEQEAMRDLVRICVDAGKTDECIHFLTSRGETELVDSTLRQLADAQLEAGDHEKAILSWKRLISADPRGPRAAGYQHEVVRAWFAAGRVEQSLDALQTLVDDYGASSTWARHNAANPDALEEAQSYIELDLRDLSISWHQQARKLGSGPEAELHYAAADALYTLYLDRWPDSTHSYALQYAHAELLWDTAQHADAWAAYMRVVEMDPKGTHSLVSAEGAVFAAEKLAPEPAEVTSMEPVAMDPWTQNLLASLDAYTTLYPSGPKAREALYRSAWLYYRHNHFAEAATRFQVVIAQDPSSREAEYAAELILTQLALAEDWVALASTAKAFSEQRGPGTPAFRENARVVQGNAELKQVNEDPDLTLAWLGSFTEHPSRDVALYNGALWLEKVDRHAEAVELREELVLMPDSELVKPALLALAAAEDDMARFEASAAHYREYALTYPEEEDAAEAAIRAAVLFEGLGRNEDAVKSLSHAMALAPEHAERPAMLLKSAELFVALERTEDARNTLRVALDEGVVEAWKPLWDIHPDIIEEALEAEDLPTDVRAAMLFSQVDYEGYAQMALDGPERQLKRQLFDKSTALRGIEAQVGAIIVTGDGDAGIAALVLLGQAYENFGDTLLASWRPPLEGEAAEYYEAGLIDQDAVLRMKAEEAYELALAKSFELGIANEHTTVALGRLQVLDPYDWPVQEEALETDVEPELAVQPFEEAL
jgi:cellulose synthase operon protein C